MGFSMLTGAGADQTATVCKELHGRMGSGATLSPMAPEACAQACATLTLSECVSYLTL